MKSRLTQSVVVMFLAVAAILPEGCTKNAREDVQEEKEQRTVNVRATIAVPDRVEIPCEIEDSLARWLGDILNVSVYGDDGRYNNKALLYLEADRDWEDGKSETWSMNLNKSDDVIAYYNHEIADSLKNEYIIWVQAPGTLAVRDKNGNDVEGIGGLYITNGKDKILASSNGKDKITLYSTNKNGFYDEIGTIEEGYFYGIDGNGNKTLDPESGYNVLLRAFRSPESADHYTNVKGRVMTVSILRQRAGSKIVIGDEIDR